MEVRQEEWVIEYEESIGPGQVEVHRVTLRARNAMTALMVLTNVGEVSGRAYNIRAVWPAARSGPHGTRPAMTTPQMPTVLQWYITSIIEYSGNSAQRTASALADVRRVTGAVLEEAWKLGIRAYTLADVAAWAGWGNVSNEEVEELGRQWMMLAIAVGRVTVMGQQSIARAMGQGDQGNTGDVGTLAWLASMADALNAGVDGTTPADGARGPAGRTNETDPAARGGTGAVTK